MRYLRSLGGILHPAPPVRSRDDIGYATCKVCDLIWSLVMLLGCAYLVFFHGESGWWFLLAVLLADGWSCKIEPEEETEEDANDDYSN